MMFVKLIEQELGLKVIREFKFNPARQWKADYYIPELKLLIEKEGGVYTHGAHGSVSGILRDIEKYNSAVILGFSVLRFLPKDLISMYSINSIKEFLRNKNYK